MLSQEELTSLFNIISDETRTFETIGNMFQKSFQKHDQFKVGVALWYLLKDSLLNLSQRLASFYIFYEIYRNELMSYTPFIPIILETLEASTNNVEKKFLVEFITTGVIKNPKNNIKNYIEDNRFIENVQVPDLKQYWQIFHNEREKFSNLSGDWVRPIIYEQDDNLTKIKDSPTPFNFTTLTKEELSFNYFEPNYMTLYPNASYSFFEDEPIWIMPGLNFDFLWDFTLSPEQNTSNLILYLILVKSLLNRVLSNKAISEEQERIIWDTLQENSKILLEIKFSPDNLFRLIESNTKFASEIYLRISKADFFRE